MNVGPGELAIVAVTVVVVGLCRWGWRDAIARAAPLAWRIVAAVPLVGTLLWLRVGRPRYDRTRC